MNAALRRSEVRLIAGQWKRSKLPVAPVQGLRPTPDRVRETLFNWLGQNLSGWRCLDAFAGSGALGFAAASRGAAKVVLLEQDRSVAASLQASRERLHATTLSVQATEALAWMARAPAQGFDLVFLDPPYDAGLLEPAMPLAARLLAPRGWVYVESGQVLPEAPWPELGLTLQRRGRAGSVHFHLLQRVDPV